MADLTTTYGMTGHGELRTRAVPAHGQSPDCTTTAHPNGVTTMPTTSATDTGCADFNCQHNGGQFPHNERPSRALHVRPIRIAAGVREANARYQEAKPCSPRHAHTATELAMLSQRQFEAMFPAGHTPMTDTRTPAQVRAQAEAEGWK